MPSVLSLSSIVQYAFLALIAYILAGAPLLSIFAGTGRKGDLYSSDASAGHSNASLDGLVIPESNLSCGNHGYKGVYVLGRDPLVIYIEGFLSSEEAEHTVGLR